MSIAKAVVSGVVAKDPEKRFTQNNIAVSSIILDIGANNDESLIRVIAKRKNLEEIVDTIKRGDKILVDGRLQVDVVKDDSGKTKYNYEIEASFIEMFGSPSEISTTNSSEDIVKFESDSLDETLIDSDEIPF